MMNKLQVDITDVYILGLHLPVPLQDSFLQAPLSSELLLRSIHTDLGYE